MLRATQLSLVLILASAKQINLTDIGDKQMIIELNDNKVQVLSESLPQNLSYDNASEVNLTIFKSIWKRGFLVNQPYFDKQNVSVSLKFYGYDGDLIEKYDEGHRYDNETCLASNYVRGVERVEITFWPKEGQKNYILLAMEPWILNKVTGPVFGFSLILYLYFIYYSMKNAKWFKKRRSSTYGNEEIDCDDDYRKQSESDSDDSEEESEKWKLNLKYTFKAIVNNLDILTDLDYIRTVAMYSPWFFYLMIISILLPFLFILLAVIIQNDEYLKDFYGQSGIRIRILEFVLLSTSLRNLYFINKMGKEDKKELERDQAGVGIFFLFEDGPQFVLQMLNSLLVGSNWKWIQVASPIFSLTSLAKRFIFKTELEQDIKGSICILTCQLVTFILPVVIVILCVFDYGNSRPEWAQMHSTIRSGFEKQPPIY